MTWPDDSLVLDTKFFFDARRSTHFTELHTTSHFAFHTPEAGLASGDRQR
jgi:hypothetical protein